MLVNFTTCRITARACGAKICERSLHRALAMTSDSWPALIRAHIGRNVDDKSSSLERVTPERFINGGLNVADPAERVFSNHGPALSCQMHGSTGGSYVSAIRCRPVPLGVCGLVSRIKDLRDKCRRDKRSVRGVLHLQSLARINQSRPQACCMCCGL